jgi:hypothetical protein
VVAPRDTTAPRDAVTPLDAAPLDAAPLDAAPLDAVTPTDAASDGATSELPFIPGGGGFSPRTHGFSFPNYDNSSMPTNLTAPEVARLFGNAVCSSGTGASCVLTAVARNWMNATNDSMKIGHCEGMSVLSVLFHRGVLSPATFAPGATSAFALTRTPALERELALWWSTQVVPGLATEVCPSGAETLGLLEETFRGGSGYAATLAMRRVVNGKAVGGHAVTPIAIERADSGTSGAIVIYDNNYPGETRRINYTNVATGAWTYISAQNPGEPPETYDGTDANNNRVCIRLTNPRLAQPTACPFCGNYSATTATRPPNGMAMLPMPGVTGSTRRTLTMQGAGNLLLVDGAGHRLGDTPTGFVSEIPGASVLNINSIDPGAVRAEPTFVVPEGVALGVTLDGSGLTETTPTDLRVFGPGYTLGVEGIGLDRAQTDNVILPATGAGILYTTRQAESATVVVGATFSGADWEFRVNTHGDASGVAIGATIDPTRGELVFYFLGATGSMNTFDLDVTRTDDAGATLSFMHTGAVEPSGSVLHLRYGAWSADGTPMTLAVDTNDDGTADSMTTLDDMPEH